MHPISFSSCLNKLLNESCEIYNNVKLLTVVTYDDFYTVNILEQEDQVLFVETITVTPINFLQLRKEDFLLGLGYETYSNCDRYQSSIDYNIEKINTIFLIKKFLKKSHIILLYCTKSYK